MANQSYAIDSQMSHDFRGSFRFGHQELVTLPLDLTILLAYSLADQSKENNQIPMAKQTNLTKIVAKPNEMKPNQVNCWAKNWLKSTGLAA